MAHPSVSRCLVLVLVMLAVVPQAYAQNCNTTLLAAVKADPRLQQLAAVIQAAGLADTVERLDNVTVIAPDNNAFNGTNGLISLLRQNNLNLTDVTAPGQNRAASILLYHIIAGPARAADLKNNQVLTTFLGSNYTLRVNKQTAPTLIVSFVGTGSNATVTAADIPVCRSIVHVVNNVLLPATNLTAIPAYTAPGAAPGSPPGSMVPTPPGTQAPPGSGASSLTVGSMAFALSAALAAVLMN